jgi:hypothetical protein
MSLTNDGMRELILSTLEGICRDGKASPSARAGAARTLAECIGMLKAAPRATPGSAPVGELSEAELDALIASRVSPGTVSGVN